MARLLDIDQLRTFVAIIESGSFTKAADDVHKTQSAVSMQMKRLEERIGKPLFERDGRQSKLTPEGSRLLEYARRMLRLNDEAMSALTEPALVGSVNLGLPDDYADRLLPRVLAAFARSHPRIEINVACEPSCNITKRIKEGRLDIGIVTHGDCSNYGEIFRREPLYWVGSEQHCSHELDPLPLALGPATCSWRRSAIDALDRIGRSYRVAYTSGAATALAGAVLAGLAVTVLPESAVRADMRILRPEDGFPSLPYCDIALLRASHATAPVHDALAGHIHARLSNLAPSAIAAE